MGSSRGKAISDQGLGQEEDTEEAAQDPVIGATLDNSDLVIEEVTEVALGEPSSLELGSRCMAERQELSIRN